MKNSVGKLALIGATAFILNAGWVLAADTTAQQTATPGTPAQTDTKSQENNPSGTTAQNTASMPTGTKKHHKKPHGSQPVANQSPDSATKSPQVSVPTSTQP